MKFNELTDAQVIELRKQIVLNSVFTSDYQNSFGINESLVQDYFDGFMDFLGELEKEDTGKTDMPWKEFMDKYDNEENLIAWHYCHDTFGDED